MNFRLAQPGHLIDLRRVAGLDGIRVHGDSLVIGAMVRQSAVEDAPEVALAAPLLAEAIGLVADRRSATAAPSAAASRTPTRPPSCPPSPSRSTPS